MEIHVRPMQYFGGNVCLIWLGSILARDDEAHDARDASTGYD